MLKDNQNLYEINQRILDSSEEDYWLNIQIETKLK